MGQHHQATALDGKPADVKAKRAEQDDTHTLLQ